VRAVLARVSTITSECGVHALGIDPDYPIIWDGKPNAAEAVREVYQSISREAGADVYAIRQFEPQPIYVSANGIYYMYAVLVDGLEPVCHSGGFDIFCIKPVLKASNAKLPYKVVSNILSGKGGKWRDLLGAPAEAGLIAWVMARSVGARSSAPWRLPYEEYAEAAVVVGIPAPEAFEKFVFDFDHLRAILAFL